LRRLGLERIDLYQLHSVDPKVPVEESVGALAELRSEGKIRHIGVSNVDESELERAQGVAPIASVQNEYNVANRASEGVLRECEREGAAFLAYFPIGAGWRAAKPVRALEPIARKRGATIQQVALAWLLQHSPVIVAIPGASSIAHLEENMASAEVQLDEEDLRALE
jgi:aryl-alcohol dehydrogenase-like predicted oxidoreductase